MKIVLMLATVTLALAGCSSKNVTVLTDAMLCRDAATGGWVGYDTKSRNEMIARGLIDSSEWDPIKNREVKIGMSECGALAATYMGAYGRYWALDQRYKFGADQTIVISAWDPRGFSAEQINYFRERASTAVIYDGPGRPPITYKTGQPEHVQQLYVPKFLVSLKGGKVTDCKAVDMTRYGSGLSPRALVSSNIDVSVFTLPCTRVVPGFEKYD